MDTVEQSLRHLDEVTGALEDLATALGEANEMGPVLQAVCEQVIRVVPGADVASITLRSGDGYQTAAATDERANEIDGKQYEQDDGPCLRAIKTGKVVRVEVETAVRLWPEFSEVAHKLGVASYLASPLAVDSDLVGAINLFGFGKHGFRELDEKYLELYTVMVETTVRGTRRYLQAREHVTQLRQAMESRAVIEQAKGILMAARGLSADAAFQVLVERSQRENVKLHTIAQRFVAEMSAETA
ncbi:GAF and ANTAR domain-containing protein [Amycolatopsis magusensis]|uniref:GAF domain-containing protein n=1 Tax=Amycolatopsis magusensis TaxID=882444 RepID=A0ABS4PQ20_9PSEU|nr:GAF and ANTAR domain-containing protein [Amycolatopsis magusensis]MBP2180995.1 GAF domain-containing protein [Amycolatopsis magusensis]MDI5976451.1 GAF and ANTAR domain-containing protein [Amycolatopsis magusensis]